MSQKVGRITLAVALIAMGVVLIVDNLQNTQITWFVARLWPALLILLGLEWVAAAARGQHPRVDGGAIALLAVVALVAWGAPATRQWQFHTPVWQARAVPVAPAWGPSVTAPPPPMARSFMTAPRFFGEVSEEVLLTRDGEAAGMQELRVNGQGVGEIRVEQGDKFRVELRVTGYGFDQPSALESARQVRLNVQPGATTQVGADRPSNGQKLGLSFLVTVPPGVNLKLESASGAIVVVGRQGSVTAQTSSGSIRVEDVKGPADLRSASGSITAAGIGGDLAATSSSGRIEASTVHGALRVGSSSGSIALTNLAGKASAQSSSGSISLTTDQVGGDYDLTATSGSVSLAIPASAGVSVNARTTSGSVTGPGWLTAAEGRGSGTGTQGDGAFKLTVRTSSGSVRLDTK